MIFVKLSDELEIPALGLGTWRLTGSKCQDAIETALEIGYRHFDTADIYGNHHQIGKTLTETSIKREEIFLVSKVWYSDLQTFDLLESAKRFLDELKTQYLDLLLIHWPNRGVPIVKSLKAMHSLKQEGLVRSIGVSNFTPRHLREALETGFQVAMNQVEFHPSLNQKDLKQFCDQNQIAITAYSPFAQGQDLKLETIKNIAQANEKTPAQVIINWIIQKGMIAIPRSSDKEHLKENFASLSWKLEDEEINRIDDLGSGNRIIRPHFADFDYQ